MTRYRQNPTVSATEVDADLFLVEPVTEEVFHLDPVAAGVWRLLAVPQDEAELVAVLAEAFPEVARDRLAADVARALATLGGGGLLLTES